jgi:hypothetical protein
MIFSSVSDPDPHWIGFLDPDPGGVKSAKTEGKTESGSEIGSGSAYNECGSETLIFSY